MFKKEFNQLSKNYSKFMYSGLIGFLMKKSHSLMEKNYKHFKNYEKIKILEIGAGNKPHIEFLKHDFSSYDVLELDENGKLEEFYKKNFQNIFFKKYNGGKIPFEDESYDRIILSHCLEHIMDPEKILNEITRIMKKDSILSIAIPTDPGLMWRIGRCFVRKHAIKTYGISQIDYEYIMAKEHVNSSFNLKSILEKKFFILSKTFYPFKFNSLDFNLFYIVDLKKI